MSLMDDSSNGSLNMERLTRIEVLSALRDQTIRIDGLESCYEGWPFATSPYVDDIHEDVDKWLMSSFPDHPMLEKLRAGDYGLFGATWWPLASKERLRVVTFFTIWLFIWDDEIDSKDGRYADDLDGAQKYRVETLKFFKNRLGLGEKDEEMMTAEDSIIEVFGSIGDTLKGATTVEERERLLKRFEAFMKASEKEQRLKKPPHMPVEEEFWKYRLGASAVWILLCLNEYCYEVNLPAHLFLDKDMIKLWDLTTRNICCVNDLLSIKKEMAADATESLVPIKYAKLRCAQSATDEIVSMVRNSAKDLDAAAERLEQKYAEDHTIDSQELKCFIDGCRYYCTGNLAWSLVTKRYGVDMQLGQREASIVL